MIIQETKTYAWLHKMIDLNSMYVVMDMMSTQPSISVEQAKKQLRQARLSEHVRNISSAIASGNFEQLANSASAFTALYRTKPKAKKA